MITIKNPKQYKWEYIEHDCLSQCMECDYTSKHVAESDSFIYDNETGERFTFCPSCKSSDYYIINEGGEND